MLFPTRRALLQTLGFGGAALAMPRMGLATSAAHRRVLFYVSSHGTVHDKWAIRAGHRDDEPYSLDLASLPDADLSPILQPLVAHKGELLVVDGVGNAVSQASGVLAHPAGSASCQAGWIPQQQLGVGLSLAGPSLDQRIAVERQTPFRSLEWSVGGLASCFDALGQALPWESDPVAAFKRLFPSGATRTDQLDVLALAATQFDDVLGRLPAHERARVELHRDLVRDLEQRLQWLDALSCEAPPAPSLPTGLSLDDASYPEEMISAFLDLGVVALSCGLTDVITLRVDDIPTATVGAPPGDLHANIAHAVTSSQPAEIAMVEHHTFHARQIAGLLDTLAAIPEGDGTLLDNTLVVWHNELSTGDHLVHTIPFVLAGLGDVIQSGTYIRLVEQHIIAGRLGVEAVGTPHNKLLTAIGTAMGLQMQDQCGALEVLASDGSPIDCTGTLPGVLR